MHAAQLWVYMRAMHVPRGAIVYVSSSKIRWLALEDGEVRGPAAVPQRTCDSTQYLRGASEARSTPNRQTLPYFLGRAFLSL